MQRLSLDMIPGVLQMLAFAAGATTRLGKTSPIVECEAALHAACRDDFQFSLLPVNRSGNVLEMIHHVFFRNPKELREIPVCIFPAGQQFYHLLPYGFVHGTTSPPHCRLI